MVWGNIRNKMIWGNVRKFYIEKPIQNPKSKIQNRIGGSVSESNQPKIALTISQTVLKTAPFTGTDALPFDSGFKFKGERYFRFSGGVLKLIVK